MSSMVFDPSLSIAGLILALTLLIAVWQFISYIDEFVDFLNKHLFLDDSSISEFIAATEQLFVPENIQKKRSDGFLNKLLLLLRWCLIAIFLFNIVIILRSDYAIFSSKTSAIDQYFGKLLNELVLQLLFAVTAFLLWFYSGAITRKLLLPLGLLIFLVDALYELTKHYALTPFFHWVQLSEFFLSGIILLIIPVLSIVIIKTAFK